MGVIRDYGKKMKLLSWVISKILETKGFGLDSNGDPKYLAGSLFGPPINPKP